MAMTGHLKALFKYLLMFPALTRVKNRLVRRGRTYKRAESTAPESNRGAVEETPAAQVHHHVSLITVAPDRLYYGSFGRPVLSTVRVCLASPSLLLELSF